jgi:hypothetical protein
MKSRGSLDRLPLEMDEGMQWLRLYNDVLDDPKVQRLPPELFKHWINLLCLANEGKERGRIPNSLEDIAFRLRISEADAGFMLSGLTNAGLLESEGANLVPHGWDERQFQSDDVNARVKAHRERNVTRNVTEENPETLHVTPPEQIQSQIQNRAEQTLAPSREPYTGEFEAFWKEYPRTNGTKLEAFKAWKGLAKGDRPLAVAGLAKWKASAHWQDGKIVYAERYLKRRMWSDDPAPGDARASPNGTVDHARLAEIDSRLAALSYQGVVEEIPRP